MITKPLFPAAVISERLSQQFGFRGSPDQLARVITDLGALDFAEAQDLSWGQDVDLTLEEIEVLALSFDLDANLLAPVINRASDEVLFQACRETGLVCEESPADLEIPVYALALSLLAALQTVVSEPDPFLDGLVGRSGRIMRAVERYQPIGEQLVVLICGLGSVAELQYLVEMITVVGHSAGHDGDLLRYDESGQLRTYLPDRC